MVGVVVVVLGALVVVVAGQFDPCSSLFSIVVSGQHLNVYVAHEPVVAASVVVGLGVVTQLIPSASLLFVSVPGQHPNLAALHSGERVVLAAAVVMPAAAVVMPAAAVVMPAAAVVSAAFVA